MTPTGCGDAGQAGCTGVRTRQPARPSRSRRGVCLSAPSAQRKGACNCLLQVGQNYTYESACVNPSAASRDALDEFIAEQTVVQSAHSVGRSPTRWTTLRFGAAQRRREKKRGAMVSPASRSATGRSLSHGRPPETGGFGRSSVRRGNREGPLGRRPNPECAQVSTEPRSRAARRREPTHCPGLPVQYD